MSLTAGFWRPFAIDPSALEQGRPEPELWEIGNWDALPHEPPQIVQRWPLVGVLNALVWDAVYWHVAVPYDPHVATALKQWVTDAKDLAARLPFGGQQPQLMMRMAGLAVGDYLNWRTAFFQNPPGIGTTRETKQRCSEALWALDQLVHGFNRAEADPELADVNRLKVEVTTFWAAFFDRWEKLMPDSQLTRPAFADYRRAWERIDRIRKAIRPGQERALMAHLLRETLTNGHLMRPPAILQLPATPTIQ